MHFAAMSLVDNGRVSIWMPTANDEDVELSIPSHPAFEIVASCIQIFNKCEICSCTLRIRIANAWFILGSRRLLTYRRLPGIEVEEERTKQGAKILTGASANDLNLFRKRVRTIFLVTAGPTFFVLTPLSVL